MFRTEILIVLALSIKCVLGEDIHAISTPTPSADQLVSAWAEETDKTSLVSVRFTRWKYSATFKNATVATGQLYVDSTSGRSYLAFREYPDDLPKVEGYTVKSGDPSTWVCTPDNVIEIEPKNAVARIVAFPSSDKANNQPLSTSWLIDFKNAHKAERTIPRRLFTDGSFVRSLSANFDLTCQLHGKDSLLVTAKARSAEVSQYASQLGFLFKTSGIRPYAIRILSAPRTTETVYTFASIDSGATAFPADFDDLMNPDLSGYKVHKLQ